MIDGTLILENPFGLPDLFWREGRFSSASAIELAYALDPLGPVTTILPASLKSAVAKRRTEYMAGRICAALALRQAGLAEHVGQDGRAPVWPEGGVGSISHTDSRVIAVVSRTHAGLGVDCENIMPAAQAQELQAMILNATEAGLRPSCLTFAAFLTLVFSAKEALYKALSSKLDRVLEFHDVMLIGFASDRLHLSFDDKAHEVLYRIDEAECLTLVQVRQ